MITPPLCLMQTCFSPSWGGLEMQALELSARQRERGLQVLLACGEGSRLAREAEARGVETLALRVHGYLHPLAIARIARTVRERSIQLVHAQYSRDLATVVPAVRLSRRRVPIVLHKRVGSYVRKRDPYHRYLYSQVACVLAVSNVIRQNVLDTTPVPPERVLTLHDAIDTRQFDPARVDRVAVRRSLGITDDQLVVGCVGRFSPGKGHEELIEATRRLVPRFPALRLVIVGEASRGESEYANGVRALASRAGLDSVAIFAGFRPDVPAMMATFDVFAFPSHAEAFGLVVIEAMAMARSVVGTRGDGVLDMVVEGETGLLVPARDAGALAESLAALLADPARRERMGAAGRARVLAHFDQRQQLDRLDAIYSGLLPLGERRSGAFAVTR